jgi:DHA1 family bicyclomycin/chloramphenicol resistance-like MFS transporter
MTASQPGALKRGAPVPLYIPLLLIGASSTTILSIDLYTPSLPHLPAYFGTDAATVQLTISLSLMAYALSLLVLGPLSDRFGRRRIFVPALIGFTLASLAASLVPTIDGLIGARLVQGALAAAEGVLGFAIINDLYEEKDSAKVFAAFGMAIALTPAVAPLLGGYIHVWFGWRANFVFMTAAGAAVAVLIFRYLPETLAAPDAGAIGPGRVVSGYGALLANLPFMGFTLACALPLLALFAFVTEGPFLMIDLLGVPTESYGLYYAVIVAAFFLSSLVANRAIDAIGLGRLLQLGFAISLLAAVVFAGVVLSDSLSPWRLTLAVALWIFGAGFAFAAAPARALAVSSGSAGYSSAMLAGLQMGCAGVGAQLIQLSHDGTAVPLMAILLASAVASFAAYAVAGRAAPA